MLNNESEIVDGPDVDCIEILIEDRDEAQKLLDVLNTAIDNGNKDEVILDLAYKFDSELCKWKADSLEIVE